MSNSNFISLDDAERHLREITHGVNNRRFALEVAERFFRPTTVRNHAAVVHVADVFFRYVHTGELPDSNENRRAVEDYARTIVGAAFPLSVIGEA